MHIFILNYVIGLVFELFFSFSFGSVLWLSFPAVLRNGLSKLGIPHEILGVLFNCIDDNEDYPKIPEAKGQISAVRSEAFFIPLYELYLTYGGIFRLKFGPKVCFF